VTLSRASIEPVPPMVSMWTDGWGLIQEGIASSQPASGTFEAADTGVYFPVYVPSVCVARRMWWINGASVTGNVEAGIYRDSGFKPAAKLITTGIVGQSGTNTTQFGEITDTVLTPSLYWLYLSESSASATFFRCTLGSSSYDELFRFQQVSIGPGSAPATATPAESTSQNVYYFGFSTHTIT